MTLRVFVNLGIGIEVFFPVFLFAEAVVLKKKCVIVICIEFPIQTIFYLI